MEASGKTNYDTLIWALEISSVLRERAGHLQNNQNNMGLLKQSRLRQSIGFFDLKRGITKLLIGQSHRQRPRASRANWGRTIRRTSGVPGASEREVAGALYDAIVRALATRAGAVARHGSAVDRDNLWSCCRERFANPAKRTAIEQVDRRPPASIVEAGGPCPARAAPRCEWSRNTAGHRFEYVAQQRRAIQKRF